MGAKQKRMDEIRKFLRLHLDGHSRRRIAFLTGSSRNTVRSYLNIVESSDFSVQQAIEMSDQQLSELVYKEQQDAKLIEFEAMMTSWKEELEDTGVTRYILWQEYIASYPSGYRYSQFCAHFSNFLKRDSASAILSHQPADCLMIDFTGKKLPWYDQLTDSWQQAEVLVCILPFSGFTFAYALASQKQEDLVEAITKCLEYMGGVPRSILSDNMKSFVEKSDRYGPKFNELCQQLATHYGLDLQATRPGKPKDKAMVEGAVKIIYTRVFAPLRKERLGNIYLLNQAIQKQLAIHNAILFQKRNHSRRDLFEAQEKPLLAPLPTTPFLIQKKVFATAQKNCHIELGEDRHYYSIPYELIGKRLTVLYSSKLVEIYNKGRRIAIHPRSTRRFAYTTQQDHLPDRLQHYQKQLGWDSQYFIRQASVIGPNTKWAVSELLTSKAFVEQTYKSCMGILSLAKKAGSQRMENCCGKCQQIGVVNYRIIKNMITNNMDMIEQDEGKFNSQQHDNIRGAKHYK